MGRERDPNYHRIFKSFDHLSICRIDGNTFLESMDKNVYLERIYEVCFDSVSFGEYGERLFFQTR